MNITRAIVPAPLKTLKLILAVQLAVAAPAALAIEKLDVEGGCPKDKAVKVDIPAQAMENSLSALAQQSGFQIVFYSKDARNVSAKSIAGEFENCFAAINALLEGTGLGYYIIDKQTISIRPVERSDRLGGRDRIFLAANGDMAIGSKRDGENLSEPEAYYINSFEIEEIVVTANKREQNVLEVPMSVTVLSGTQLDQSGITDLQSLSLAVPGLFVAESGSYQRRISIRGIGNIFGSSSLVGIYLDEAPVVATPSNQIDLRAYDLERVEVLKGPQGTLYGEGSVGGTIRYITNDPVLIRFSGTTSINGSFTKNGTSSKEFRSVLNIPLSDSLGLRVVGQYVDSGGWIDQPALEKKDINYYELFNIQSKFLWQPTDKVEIKTTYIIHRNDAGADNIGEDNSGNYRQVFDIPTTPSSIDNYDIFNVLINYNLGGLKLVSSTSYLDVDKERIDSGGECCFPTNEAGELWNISVPYTSTSAEIFSQELRLSTNNFSSWGWTVGLFYRDANLIPLDTQGGLFGVPGGELNVNIFEFETYQEEQSKSWALFGETSYALTDNLFIGAGLRYFEDNRKLRSTMHGPFQEGSFDSLNPKIYVGYSVTDDIRVYANAAKGFRSGGLNGAGNPPFEPEEVISYELGAKMYLFDRRINAEIALFQSDYNEYQIIGVIPQLGLNITSNAGKAKVKGIDLSFKYFATDQMELGFTGNYMDTEFIEINAVSTSHAEGDPLDLVPQYGYSLWGNYSFNWLDSSPGYVRLDYNRQGKSHFRNRSFSPDYHETSDIIDMLNARVGWKKDKWKIELYALNILNENGFIGPGGKLEKNQSRPRPQTIGINLGVIF